MGQNPNPRLPQNVPRADLPAQGGRPRKKARFRMLLPLVAVGLLTCAPPQPAHFQDSLEVYAPRPRTGQEQRVLDAEEGISRFKERYGGDKARGDILQSVLSGPPEESVRALPLLAALFAHADRFPELEGFMLRDRSIPSLASLRLLMENPNFTEGMFRPYEGITSAYWGVRTLSLTVQCAVNDGSGRCTRWEKPEKSPDYKGMVFAVLDRVLKDQNLSVGALESLHSAIDSISEDSEKKEAGALEELCTIASTPGFTARALGMIELILVARPAGDFMGGLRLVRAGLERGTLTPRMLDFFDECRREGGPLDWHDALRLNLGVLSNPEFKASWFGPLAASLRKISSNEELGAFPGGFSGLFGMLASNPSFEPWMPEAYTKEYFGRVRHFDRWDGSGFGDALEAYAGNPRVEISRPKEISSFLLLVYRRRDEDARSVLGQLEGIFKAGNMGAAEFSSLKSMTRRAKGKPMTYFLDAFGYMLANAHYSASMLADFERVFSIIYSRTEGEMRRNALSDFSDMLEEGKGDGAILQKELFLLGKKRMGNSFELLEYFSKKKALEDMDVFKARYAEAEELAKSIGANYKDAEVCTNFAYAIDKVGAETAERLFREYGIEFFARHSPEMLEELRKGLNPGYMKDSPIFLMGFAKEDWNGVFYDDGRYSEFIGKYRFIAVESASDSGMFDRILSLLRKREGIPGATAEVSVMEMNGHGKRDRMWLGPEGRGAASKITASDMRKLGRLSGYFSTNSIIVLDSCDTGKGKRPLAASVSSALPGVPVYAPQGSYGVKSYLPGKDGMIRRPEFRRSMRVYLNGKIHADWDRISPF